MKTTFTRKEVEKALTKAWADAKHNMRRHKEGSTINQSSLDFAAGYMLAVEHIAEYLDPEREFQTPGLN